MIAWVWVAASLCSQGPPPPDSPAPPHASASAPADAPLPPEGLPAPPAPVGIIPDIPVPEDLMKAGPAAPDPQVPPAAPRQRAMVLPVKLPANASVELQSAARTLEGQVAEALARHAGFDVVTRVELGSLVGAALQAQLLGCDAESCMADIADAMGTQLMVTQRLDLADGYWNLLSTLLDVREARALRRAQIRARGLDQLLASVDILARTLAAGSNVAVDDPQLMTRLGTNEEGLAALQDRVKGKDVDVVSAWTQLVVDKNSESGRLSLLQGSLAAGVGVSAVTTAVVAAVAAGYYFNLLYAFQLKHAEEGAPLMFPWLAALVALVAPLPPALVLGGLMAALVGVSVWDVLDLGRVKVKRTGCCRDEPQVQAAGHRTPLRFASVIVAAAGALFATLTPCAFCATQTLCLAPVTYANIRFEPDETDPAVQMDERSLFLAATGHNALLIAGLVAVTIPAALSSLVATLLLMRFSTNDLLDDEDGT